jgi:glucokinase
MDWAKKIRGVVGQLQSEVGNKARSFCVGLSAPGLAASDGRSIAHMPGRLQGLEGLDWTKYLESAMTVPVLNDGHAALLGEVWLGAAKGFRNVIMLTLGTGVGGAAMVDGQLLRGHLGRAGHLGHSCLDIDGPPDVTGTPGSLEVAIGNCTIAERSQGRFQTTHDLVAAHRAGEAAATAVWLKSVRALACAIASFVNILDPQAVVIGGGIAASGAALFEPLQRFLDEAEWQPGGARVKILPALLGEFAGAFGAAWNALKQ